MNFDHETKALSSLNCITPLAFAGHGKDYFCQLIKEQLNKEFYNLSFSDPIKKILAESFSKNKLQNLIKITPEYEGNIDTTENIYHYFEYLKNDRHDVKVFDQLNMRELMIFLMGKEFLLKADPTIKIKLACHDAIEQLEKNPNTIFLANSTRYEEEIIFSFLLNNEEKPLDFFYKYLGNYRKKDNIHLLNEIIMNLKLDFDFQPDDKETLNNLSINLTQKLFNINKFEAPLIDFKEKGRILASQYAFASDYDKATAFGVFHIFRPLLPRNLKDEKNINIDKEIIKYTDMNPDELTTIKLNYRKYNIKFNFENIQDFGYLRSNPKNPSENNLMLYKGIAFLNEPNLTINSIFKQLRKMEDLKLKLKKETPMSKNKLKK